MIASVALCLLAAEGAARLILPAPTGARQVAGFAKALVWKPIDPSQPLEPGDPVLSRSLYRFRPGSIWGHVYPDNRDGYFDRRNQVVYAMNRQGYRGGDFAIRRTPGVARSILIGDSFTFGEGVWLDQTWGHLLERALAGVGIPNEVYNFGVGGYCHVDEIVLLREILAAYRPDVVVWGYFLNDIDHEALDRLSNETNALRGRWLAVVGPSRLASWAFERVWRRYLSARTTRAYRALYDDPGRLGRVRESLVEAAERSRRVGADLLVVLFPDLQGVSADDYVFAGIHDRLATLLAANGIRHLDLTGAVRRAGPSPLTVHPTDPHPNRRVHEVIAREVQAAIETSLRRRAPG
jgi:LmbE family N-acetylglucosaminyl deacetylase